MCPSNKDNDSLIFSCPELNLRNSERPREQTGRDVGRGEMGTRANLLINLSSDSALKALVDRRQVAELSERQDGKSTLMGVISDN